MSSLAGDVVRPTTDQSGVIGSVASVEVRSTLYEIRIEGCLDPATLATMRDLNPRVGRVDTVLTGDFGQARLQSFLTELQDLGLTLISMRQERDSDFVDPVRPPQLYELRLHGSLDAQDRELLGPVVERADGNVHTLVCRVEEQSHLQGLIELVRWLGLELVAIRPWHGAV